ncbi:MAG: molecular chaperone [Gammaproteobacteria bacterium]|nr:molecular chaperone [Gammaproteobacteria bacterium]
MSAAAGAILLCTGFAAHAGSLLLDHTRLDLSPRQPVAEMAIENNGTTPALVQSQIYAWSQVAGVDQLTPSDALLVSPPIFEIAPGARQLVRVGMLGAADPSRETPYRVIFQEVPLPTESEGVAVAVLLRISFPVFVAPAAATASADLQWRAARTSDDRIEVTLSNVGNGHVQVTGLDLTGADGEALASSGSFLAYVLPGQQRSWSFELDAPPSDRRLRLKAVTGQGEVLTELELEGS